LAGVSHPFLHAAIEEWLAGEQSALRILFALGGVYFLKLHRLSDEHSMFVLLPASRTTFFQN
jgi:hypothetical protein